MQTSTNCASTHPESISATDIIGTMERFFQENPEPDLSGGELLIFKDMVFVCDPNLPSWTMKCPPNVHESLKAACGHAVGDVRFPITAMPGFQPSGIAVLTDPTLPHNVVMMDKRAFWGIKQQAEDAKT